MKRKVIVIISLLLLGTNLNYLAAQTAKEVFNEKFPELSGALKADGTVEVTKDNIELFRAQYKKLADAKKDVENVEYSLANKDNMIVFEYKPLKRVKKVANLDSVKQMIVSNRTKIRCLLKDKDKYGADKDKCIEEISLLGTLMQQKDYKNAYSHWRYLFQFYPLSHSSVYTKGKVLIKLKIKEAQNLAVKKGKAAKAASKANKPVEEINKLVEEQKEFLKERQAWIDTLMMIYNKRIKYYPKKKYSIMGKQAKDLYKYRVSKVLTKEEKENRKLYTDTAYHMLKDVVKNEKEMSHESNMQYLFFASDRMYKYGKIDPEEVVDNYTLLVDLLQARITKYQTKLDKIKKHKNRKWWKKFVEGSKKVEANITDKFAKAKYSKCSVLVPAFEPKFEKNKTNIEWLKKITDILISKKNDTCTDCKLYENSIIALYKLEPSANAAYKLAAYYIKKTPPDYVNASKYFKEAYTQEKDSLKKADYYYQAALVESAQGRLSSARTLALKSYGYNKKSGLPFVLIAKLYVQGKASTSDDKIEQKFVYWLAVDKLERAKAIDTSVVKKANNLIFAYKKNYPKTEKVIFKDINEGDKVKIGGWIQETTTAKYK